jgi:hypothetical protein
MLIFKAWLIILEVQRDKQIVLLKQNAIRIPFFLVTKITWKSFVMGWAVVVGLMVQTVSVTTTG